MFPRGTGGTMLTVYFTINIAYTEVTILITIYHWVHIF